MNKKEKREKKRVPCRPLAEIKYGPSMCDSSPTILVLLLRRNKVLYTLCLMF